MTAPRIISTHRIILAAMLVSLSACGGGSDDSSAASGPPVHGQNGSVNVSSVVLSAEYTCEIPDFARAMLSEVNRARSQARNCGGTAYGAAQALGWNELLAEASMAQAQDMAAANKLADSGSPVDRVASTGYEFQAVGENIAQGYTTIPKLMTALLASAEHCKKIMSPVLTEMAAACVRSSSGKAYWAQTFAKHTPFE